MTKQQKTKYLTLVYALVTTFAIILAILAFIRGEDTWQSLLLNLATEFLGVVLIFFLVNIVFAIEEWSLSERVQELIDKLEHTETLSATTFFRERSDLTEHFATARTIDLCGVNLRVKIQEYYSSMFAAIQRGCHVRIMISDPDSCAVETAAHRSSLRDLEHYKLNLETTLKDLARLHEAIANEQAVGTGSLEVRLLPHVPAYGISAFNAQSADGKIFIRIYPHQSPNMSPTFPITSQQDGEWYAFFAQQYENIWNSATPWSPQQAIE